MMEFTFDASPWEQMMEALRPGDRVTAVQCLTLLETVSEEEAEEALLSLAQMHVSLDIAELPLDSGSSEAALRLRQERELVAEGTLLKALEENDPLRLYLEELANIPAAGDVQLLAERYAAGDEAVMQDIVNLSLSQVVDSACRFVGRGVLLLDLIQEGSLGLWQGILNYHAGDFRSYAAWWIEQY